VSCRKKGTEYFNLFLVTLSPPRVVPLPTDTFAYNGDLINPRWHPNGKALFFQHREGAQSNLIVLRNAPEVGRLAPTFTAFPTPGTSILMGSPADQPLVKWSDFSHPPRVESWDIDQGVTELKERSLLPPWITPSKVTHVPLKTSDDHTVMTYHWHAKSTACSPSPSDPASKSSSVKRGVLVINAGLRNQVLDVWNVAHGILSNFGVEVVSLNYRGATGRGASFENTPDAHIGRLEDILAAWRYMTTTLSIPAENISIVGIGYGGQLAVDLVSHEYASIKIAPRQIVLISPSIVIPEPSINKKLVAFKGSLSVFRGGWDRTDEKAIRKYIDARFPGIAASKPIGKQAANERFKWTIFFREGAGLQTTMSLAETVNSVLVGAGVSQVFSPYRPC
jgi:hypothetical protein